MLTLSNPEQNKTKKKPKQNHFIDIKCFNCQPNTAIWHIEIGQEMARNLQFAIAFCSLLSCKAFKYSHIFNDYKLQIAINMPQNSHFIFENRFFHTK